MAVDAAGAVDAACTVVDAGGDVNIREGGDQHRCFWWRTLSWPAGGRCDGGSCETPAADATPMAGAMGNRLEQI